MNYDASNVIRVLGLIIFCFGMSMKDRKAIMNMICLCSIFDILYSLSVSFERLEEAILLFAVYYVATTICNKDKKEDNLIILRISSIVALLIYGLMNLNTKFEMLYVICYILCIFGATANNSYRLKMYFLINSIFGLVISFVNKDTIGMIIFSIEIVVIFYIVMINNYKSDLKENKYIESL